MDAIILMASDSHGVYAPQVCMAALTDNWQGISADDAETIQKGPDAEWYWEAWHNILNSAFCEIDGKRYSLHQDGDIWAICPDAMTNDEYMSFFGEMKPAPDDAYEYAVCADCLIALANDDYSGMDDAQEKATRAGLDALHAEYARVIPDGAEYGFSHNRCECCDALPGERYRVFCFKD